MWATDGAKDGFPWSATSAIRTGKLSFYKETRNRGQVYGLVSSLG